MLFNSLHFVLFFPAVFLILRLIPEKFRWIILLLASYYFYMAWEISYALLILFSTVVDYFAALQMQKATTLRGRKTWLYASLISNLGLLFVFKYYNFFSDSVNALFQTSGLSVAIPYHEFLLPVGISFYTFQTLSYTIDVFRGDKKAETHFGIFALYVSFFPQLVAGPIERSTRLLPQFFEHKAIRYIDVSSGVKQMLWGFFKKMVIADRLAFFVDHVYANPEAYPGFPLVLATFFFAIQIYCDFSGYSDIAIGSARILGFELMENFKKPYFSSSISEFWSRWHISLSTWFRDYVYIPLGGNRVSGIRWMANIMITFTVSGLWHGANWTFVVWGALNGLYLILGRQTLEIRDRLFRWLPQHLRKPQKILFTFFLTFIAWIFFRAASIGDAWYVLTHLLDNPGYLLLLPSDLFTQRSFILKMGLDGYEMWVAIVTLILFHIVEWFHRRKRIFEWTSGWTKWGRWSFYQMILFAVVMFGVTDQQAFIYFQF